MGSFIIEYPGSYYDSKIGGYVITRYAKKGRIAVMRLLLGDGDKIMNVMLPKVIPDKMKAELKKCYEFEWWL